jgi:predicted transcriptional regulator
MTDPLELDTRQRLYRYVTANPGKYLRELQRDLGMAMGALEYHLDYLERHGLVNVLHGSNKRFFPTQMNADDRRLLSHLRETLPRRVLVLLIERGRRSKSELLAALDVAPSTLNYHLKRLEGADLVRSAREGREAVYDLPRPEPVIRLLVAHRSSWFDRFVERLLEGMDSIR